MTPSLAAICTFPLHLRSPADFISIWFVLRSGEEKSWTWQMPSLEPALTQAILLLWMTLENSNTSSPRETSVPNFSLIPQGSSFFAKGFGCSSSFFRILSFEKHFVGVGTLQVFPLPPHPDVSGSQDVHL